ncbi:MAG: 3-deoxy-manno-octulosonate cytidylyltransferase [Acidobacteria bacterium]|nr:3-deoxy-manno-octulosonate cytidylyltransferase [Acidobacteriota bacterium]
MGEKVVAVIPARYESTRLPGKPLLEIAGVPLVMHVARQVRKAAGIDRIIVATDDQRVWSVVESGGVEAMMTSADHRSGTDRLAEVASQIEADIIVNVQGDEPLIDPATIELAIEPLRSDGSLQMATTSEPLDSVEDLLSPHVVKVVTNRQGNALLFSRSPIPFPRAGVLAAGSITAAIEGSPELLQSYRKHTGLYVYRREFLLQFSRWTPTALEIIESLEQLRALENGVQIRVVPVSHRSYGVDTPADLQRVRDIVADSLSGGAENSSDFER